jgi:hypothetical protein
MVILRVISMLDPASLVDLIVTVVAPGDWIGALYIVDTPLARLPDTENRLGFVTLSCHTPLPIFTQIRCVLPSGAPPVVIRKRGDVLKIVLFGVGAITIGASGVLIRWIVLLVV